MNNSIEDLRKSIDKIDTEILKLLDERMNYVKDIGKIKNLSNATIYRPEREKEIIDRLVKENPLNLNKKAIEAIFFEIFSISRNLEKPQNIAFLGPYGTYSHQAAKLRFGSISSYIPLSNIEAVFKEVCNKGAKYGVVPVENNTEGGVGVTLDCLNEYQEINIVAEIYMDIHHCFASYCEKLNDIKVIYSHPQGYNQCLQFLEDHSLSEVEFIATKSTALAAKLANENRNSAAICSQIAANLHKVPVMFEKIEDNLANKTRFFVLSDFKNPKTKNDKTSIMAKTDHAPGALASLLGMFKDEGINLTKLESRPIKKKDFKTNFYIDFEGHIDDEKVLKVLKQARNVGSEIIWLGSYLNGDKS